MDIEDVKSKKRELQETLSRAIEQFMTENARLTSEIEALKAENTRLSNKLDEWRVG